MILEYIIILSGQGKKIYSCQIDKSSPTVLYLYLLLYYKIFSSSRKNIELWKHLNIIKTIGLGLFLLRVGIDFFHSDLVYVKQVIRV